MILFLFCLFGVWPGVWAFFSECFVIFWCLVDLVFRSHLIVFSRFVFVRCFLECFFGRGVGFMQCMARLFVMVLSFNIWVIIT